MDTSALTVRHIEKSGFEKVAFWQYREARLICDAALPKSHGVYAFGVDDLVMYVGLASRSIAKRLYFYSNPGASQSTNIRVRALLIHALRMSRVSIHVALPPDHEWNGLTVRGAEGLEAGIIRHFHLPWNKRGGSRINAPTLAIVPPPITPVASSSLASLSTILEKSLSERVLANVQSSPGMTEVELARLLFGRSGYQQKINPVCRRLVDDRKVRRVELGGASDPYRYWPA